MTAADPWIGVTFGDNNRYKLIELLGQGGAGKVYKALDHQTSEHCAVKFLSSNLLSNIDAKLRFQREAQACLLLQDPLIVRTLDFGIVPMTVAGQKQELPMLVMELVKDKTLHDFMHTQGRLSLKLGVYLARQIAEALDVVHQGIIVDGKRIQFIHRDLKPDNIFVIPNGSGYPNIKLADFGLVKFLGDLADQDLTKTGLYAGTPEYSSPEQINQFKKVDPRSDLYSLGCILYQLVGGTNLYHFPRNTSYIDWLKAHTSSAPKSFSQSLNCPQSLEDLVFRCVAKDPDHRFQTARELADALAEINATLPDLDQVTAPLDWTRLLQVCPSSVKLSSRQHGSQLILVLDHLKPNVDQQTAIATVLPDYLSDLHQAGLESLTVYTRAPGHRDPDWGLCTSASQLQGVGATSDSSDPATSETTQLEQNSLSGYCFVRNLSLVSTSLPDPPAPIAQAVRFIHQLPLTDKHILFPLLEKRYKDPHSLIQEDSVEAILALSPEIQDWFQTLQSMDERSQRTVAIWLSRYCANPEKVLPRLTASVVAAKKAEEVTQDSPAPQSPVQLPVERIIFRGYRHWILFLHPLGPLMVQWSVAMALISFVTPQRLNDFLMTLTRPAGFAVAFIVLLFLARLFAGIMRLIYPIQMVRNHPFSVLGTLIAGLVALLYSLQVPRVIVLSLVGFVTLVSLGLHGWVIFNRYRYPQLALTDRGCILLPIEKTHLTNLHSSDHQKIFSFQIHSLEVEQDPIGRWLQFGQLTFFLKDQPSITLKTLVRPEQIRALYHHQLDRLQQLTTNIQVAQAYQPEDPWLKCSIGDDQRYQIERLIGRGGMGTVYKGFDRQLNLPVAIKFMQGDLTENVDRLKQFQAEMRASIYLTDERIVQILNTGNVEVNDMPMGTTPFLVMEYISSPTLAQAMDSQSKWPLSRVVSIGLEIALALRTLHTGVMMNDQRINFVHRDLKPANIFLVKDPTGCDTIKLADFGLVKMMGTPQPSTRETGRIVGTARYVSPEQCRGVDTIDGRADIYSLGCILYELLTGTNPFGLSPKASATQFLMAQVQQPPIPFPDYLTVPTDLSDLIFQCLAKHPEHRWSSVDSLIEKLTHIKHQL